MNESRIKLNKKDESNDDLLAQIDRCDPVEPTRETQKKPSLLESLSSPWSIIFMIVTVLAAICFACLGYPSVSITFGALFLWHIAVLLWGSDSRT